MAFQPYDELNNLCNLYDNTNVEEYSQNIIPNPQKIFTFSQGTNIANDQSLSLSSCNNILLSNDDDPNDIEKGHSITSDIEKNIYEMIENENFQFQEFSCAESPEWLTEELDRIGLKPINELIENQSMSIETEPPANIRRRYQSDGKRQIEKSRSKPMAIKLPDLSNCILNSNQSFWIQLILITSNENPTNTVYIHVDKLEYHVDDLPEGTDGFVRIPLTQTDIEKGIKQLARISIIKTKLDTYSFELKQFDPLLKNNPIEIYENKNAKSTVAKAKCFRDTYNLNSSRIACQLLIKQNERWHTTKIVCETNIMKEQEKKNNSKSSKKRAVSSDNSDDEDDDEYEYQVRSQTSAKKQKRSSAVPKGLPVTRVKKC